MQALNFYQPNNIPIPGKGRIYELTEEYTCHWSDDQGKTYQLKIPKGYRCDGASVPRVLWSISDLTPDGVIRGPATLHDRLYENQGKVAHLRVVDGDEWVDSIKVFTRKDADQLFRAYMKAAGVNKTTRRRAYWAVRLFGWYAWKTK